MTVDMRSRIDGEPASIEPAELFEVTLPDLFAESQDRLSQSLEELRPRPLTIAVGGRCWSLGFDGDRITISKGSTTGTVLRVDAEQLAVLIADKVTPMGWLTTGNLDTDGHLSDVLNWWLLLRASLDGTTPHLRGAIELQDRNGEQLDLGRSFAPDEPADEMAWFLEQAGYLHIKGLYRQAEMTAISIDMDIAAPRYFDGDGRSWWASLKDGTRALVRMQRFDEESRAAADLVADERLRLFKQQLANLTLAGRPFRAENGVVVALRRRCPMVLRDRQLAGRWSRVVGPSLLPPLMFRSSTRIRFSSSCAAPRATTPYRIERAQRR